jgi:hypothetical protein
VGISVIGGRHHPPQLGPGIHGLFRDLHENSAAHRRASKIPSRICSILFAKAAFMPADPAAPRVRAAAVSPPAAGCSSGTGRRCVGHGDNFAIDKCVVIQYFGVQYYAGLRPEEAAMLGKEDRSLPEAGCGELLLSNAEPIAEPAWTDSGARRDKRQLKQRGRCASCPALRR